MLRMLMSDSHLTRRELKLRSSLLLKAERTVRRQNSNAEREFNMAINKFSIMVSFGLSIFLFGKHFSRKFLFSCIIFVHVARPELNNFHITIPAIMHLL